jgi:hypothetical protein
LKLLVAFLTIVSLSFADEKTIVGIGYETLFKKSYEINTSDEIVLRSP